VLVSLLIVITLDVSRLTAAAIAAIVGGILYVASSPSSASLAPSREHD